MAVFEGEMRKKDQLIEELIKLHPSHGLNKVINFAILNCFIVRI